MSNDPANQGQIPDPPWAAGARQQLDDAAAAGTHTPEQIRRRRNQLEQAIGEWKAVQKATNPRGVDRAGDDKEKEKKGLWARVKGWLGGGASPGPAAGKASGGASWLGGGVASAPPANDNGPPEASHASPPPVRATPHQPARPQMPTPSRWNFGQMAGHGGGMSGSSGWQMNLAPGAFSGPGVSAPPRQQLQQSAFAAVARAVRPARGRSGHRRMATMHGVASRVLRSVGMKRASTLAGGMGMLHGLASQGGAVGQAGGALLSVAQPMAGMAMSALHLKDRVVGAAKHGAAALRSEEFGETGGHLMRAAGNAIGVVNPAVGGLVKLGAVAFDAVAAIRKWTDGMHEANMKFAEFSSSMALVGGMQRYRDILYGRERGERRAGTAEDLAKAKSDFREKTAPWEDAWANFKNSFGAMVLKDLGEVVDIGNYMMEKLGDIFPKIKEALDNLKKGRRGPRDETLRVLNEVNKRGNSDYAYDQPPRFR